MFGLMPFSIAYDLNERVIQAKITIFDRLWTVFSICAYLFCAYMAYCHMLD